MENDSSKTPLAPDFNSCLGKTLHICRPEKMSSEDLRRTANQEPVASQILTRKWGWIGHTLRKPASNITRQVLTWNPQGKRKRGRPRVGLATPSGSLPANHQVGSVTWNPQEKRKKGRPRNTWCRDTHLESAQSTMSRLQPKKPTNKQTKKNKNTL